MAFDDAPQADDGLPKTGFVRQSQFLGKGKPIPLSPATWWRGIKSEKYPKPRRLGANSVAWKVSDIRDLIKQIEAQAA